LTGQVAIDARGVSKIFGQGSNEVRALDDVSVQIRPNEFFTLLGPSGCGKTTLLRLIAGFETPSLGSIFLDGADITLRPPFQRPVNTVFQSYALFPHLSVAENIGFGLEMQGRAKSDTAETVREMLALVRMEAMADRKPGQLSGGQQQRVALARALAPKPSVLLLDEPLSALDLKLRKEMQIELKRLQTETGITFVFVTHDQEEALTMSDRIGVMSAGKLLQIGSPRDIYDNPSNRFVAGFIGESNFLQGAVKSVSGDVAIVALANGCDQAALVPAGVTPSGKATLSIRPEQIVVTQENRDGAMPATVESTVYFGTDTHCHLRLEGGDILVSRVQNNTDGGGRMKAGDRVGVTFATGAARVLGD
jgi:spermidine/putrescine transport system ATP-binding protein